MSYTGEVGDVPLMTVVSSSTTMLPFHFHAGMSPRGLTAAGWTGSLATASSTVDSLPGVLSSALCPGPDDDVLGLLSWPILQTTRTHTLAKFANSSTKWGARENDCSYSPKPPPDTAPMRAVLCALMLVAVLNARRMLPNAA